MFVQVTFDSKW